MDSRVLQAPTWHRRTYISLSVALLCLAFALLTLAQRAQARPIWSYFWQEGAQRFCDYGVPVCTYATGDFGINLCYVSNPPTVCQQLMAVDISDGAAYGIGPDTYSSVYNSNGSFMGDYSIAGGACQSPGYPDATVCGDNYSNVYTANTPMNFDHVWLALDSGVVVGSGYWAYNNIY